MHANSGTSILGTRANGGSACDRLWLRVGPDMELSEGQWISNAGTVFATRKGSAGSIALMGSYS